MTAAEAYSGPVVRHGPGLCLDPPGAPAALLRRIEQWLRLAGPDVARALCVPETGHLRCPLCGAGVPPDDCRIRALWPPDAGMGLEATLETPPRPPPQEVWFGMHPACAPTTEAGWVELAYRLRALVWLAHVPAAERA